jgi:hypothetical protein
LRLRLLLLLLWLLHYLSLAINLNDLLMTLNSLCSGLDHLGPSHSILRRWNSGLGSTGLLCCCSLCWSQL